MERMKQTRYELGIPRKWRLQRKEYIQIKMLSRLTPKTLLERYTVGVIVSRSIVTFSCLFYTDTMHYLQSRIPFNASQFLFDRTK